MSETSHLLFFMNVQNSIVSGEEELSAKFWVGKEELSELFE